MTISPSPVSSPTSEPTMVPTPNPTIVPPKPTQVPDPSPAPTQKLEEDKGNWIRITKWQYPKYGQIITEIHFLKLSQDEINQRYNTSSRKDGLDWTGKANAKSWLEGTKLIIASPKTIFLTSNPGCLTLKV